MDGGTLKKVLILLQGFNACLVQIVNKLFKILFTFFYATEIEKPGKNTIRTAMTKVCIFKIFGTVTIIFSQDWFNNVRQLISRNYFF